MTRMTFDLRDRTDQLRDAPSIPRQRRGPLTDRVAHHTLLVWWALFIVGLAVEPAPAEAAATQLSLLLDVVVPVVFLGIAAATVAGLGGRRRWGAWSATAGGAYVLALAIACPATGHHQVGAWWGIQLATAVGMTAAGYLATRSRA